MTINDTYKYGSLYVDADLVIDNLIDGEEITHREVDMIEKFRESSADFDFDPDYPHDCIYRNDGQVVPLIRIGTFGGYPGEALDDANAQAAEEWAEDKDHILVTTSWFGGCKMVTLWYMIDREVNEDDVEEAIDLAERFQDYPVLDEDLYSEISSVRWFEMVEEMIQDHETDHEYTFTDLQKDQIRELVNEFQGYWEDGYFPSGEWDKIVDDVLEGNVQLHQDTQLDMSLIEGGNK